MTKKSGTEYSWSFMETAELLFLKLSWNVNNIILPNFVEMEKQKKMWAKFDPQLLSLKGFY